jgi:5'-deoxynucleotidase YfbR-like HD superfamily hydrolase
MHDATEAFLGDMVSPLKRMIPEYKEIESELHEIIMRRFGLPFMLNERVKEADLMALAIEQRELWGNYDNWAVLEGVARAEWTLFPDTPTVAKAQFMRTYSELKSIL